MIKNVIFDVGNVLVSWNPTETMIKLGFSDATIKTLHEKLFDTDVWSEDDRGVLSPDEVLSLLISQAPALEKEIRLFYENATDSIGRKAYAIPWINALKSAGYNTYVLSNFGEGNLKKVIDKGAVDFLDYLDGYVFSYAVKLIKPDVPIYQYLLDKYNLKAEESVFIDDKNVNVIGARNVGLHSFQFTSYEQAIEELAKLGVTF